MNRKYNFDDLGQALMALFVLSSKDGWVNIMYTGLDAVGVDMQVRRATQVFVVPENEYKLGFLRLEDIINSQKQTD